MLFKKSQTGWRLLQQSVALLDEVKILWILPFLGRGFFFLMITAITVFVWLVRYGVIPYQFLTNHILAIYLITLLLLWLGNLVSTYFSVALTYCLIQKDNSQPIKIKKGLRFALRRFGVIFTWILAHFMFGPFITIFRTQFSETGKVNRALSGLSWGQASMFIPTLIANEPTNFISTLKRSSQLLSQHAGKNPRLNYSYLWISLIFRGLAILPLTIAVHLHHNEWIILGATLTIILLLTVVAILNGVFTVIAHAFYQFMAHDKILPNFKKEDLTSAISP